MSLSYQINKMYKLGIITFLLINSLVLCIASPVDSVKTHYKNGQFITYTQIWVNASKPVINDVVNDYVYQTKYDLDALFDWALKGLKLRNEKDDLIIFNFKSTKYDEKNDLIKGVGDVEVPGVIEFPDIHVNSRMTKSVLEDGRLKVNIDVLYSDAFLKKTSAVFYAIQKSNKGAWISLETKVEFGWFFNIFVTQSTFRYIMEWRFQRMMHNIKAEAERREKLEHRSAK